MDIKILVATHKKYWMPDDDVYLPIEVGAYNKEDFGYTKDNIGDNISAKNPNYCELTALYWAWKNLDCEYIGLCHYRRYFSYRTRRHSLRAKRAVIYKRKDYEKLLNKYDIILPRATYLSESGQLEYEHNHYKEDLDKIKQIISDFYPDYIDNYNNIMNNNKFYFFNMFVMKKSLFNEYCNWVFPILFRLEQIIDISSYNTYQSRVFGFLSERLFNIWLDKQHLNIFESRIIFLEGATESKKITYLKNFFKKFIKYRNEC